MAGTKKPLIIDIHIPYCVRPENYIDHFYSTGSNEEKNAYMYALGRELQSYEKDIAQDYEVHSVRLSGGSATVMKPDLLGHLLAKVWEHFPMVRGAEVSFDAHPLTIGTPSLTGISAGHPNRAELMMRSFNDEELETLGCSFKMQNVRNAVAFFNRFNMTNLGLTINYGIPGQSEISWKNTLKACTIMHPSHITVQKIDHIPNESLLSKDALLNMYRTACDFLKSEGYQQYNATCFCLPHREYMFEVERLNGCEVIGVGAGAKSLWDGYCIQNVSSLNKYIQNAGDISKTTAAVSEASKLTMMQNYAFGRLQSCQGLIKADFERRFEQSLPEEIERVCEEMSRRGWLETTEDGTLLATTEGLYHYKELAEI